MYGEIEVSDLFKSGGGGCRVELGSLVVEFVCVLDFFKRRWFRVFIVKV